MKWHRADAGVKIEYDMSSVGEQEKFSLKYVWAAFADWQTWLHILVYMSVVAPRKCLGQGREQF